MNLDTYMTKYLDLDPQWSPKDEEKPSKFDRDQGMHVFGQVWPRQALPDQVPGALRPSQARSGR